MFTNVTIGWEVTCHRPIRREYNWMNFRHDNRNPRHITKDMSSQIQFSISFYICQLWRPCCPCRTELPLPWGIWEEKWSPTWSRAFVLSVHPAPNTPFLIVTYFLPSNVTSSEGHSCLQHRQSFLSSVFIFFIARTTPWRCMTFVYFLQSDPLHDSRKLSVWHTL